MLTENTLLELSLDALFELMIEKIQEIKLLDHYRAYDELYHNLMEEIKLIHQVIAIKKS